MNEQLGEKCPEGGWIHRNLVCRGWRQGEVGNLLGETWFLLALVLIFPRTSTYGCCWRKFELGGCFFANNEAFIFKIILCFLGQGRGFPLFFLGGMGDCLDFEEDFETPSRFGLRCLSWTSFELSVRPEAPQGGR